MLRHKQWKYNNVTNLLKLNFNFMADKLEACEALELRRNN